MNVNQLSSFTMGSKPFGAANQNTPTDPPEPPPAAPAVEVPVQVEPSAKLGEKTVSASGLAALEQSRKATESVAAIRGAVHGPNEQQAAAMHELASPSWTRPLTMSKNGR